MFLGKNNSAKAVAVELGIPFVDTATNLNISRALKRAKHDLRKGIGFDWFRIFRLQNKIQHIRKTSETSDRAIANAYDIEYAGTKPNYGYANALLSPIGFERITHITLENARKLSVIDIGAGSNEFLRFCHQTLNIPAQQLHGSDISPASKAIIERDGFTGYVGRAERLGLSANTFNLAYLSYFIDYDTDQRSTFSATINIVRPGGTIVLEGLFPVQPFALLDKDKDSFSFITKGQNAAEDIKLVIEAFKELGTAQQKQVRPIGIVKSSRYVYSHYGFNKLPFYFITFSVS